MYSQSQTSIYFASIYRAPPFTGRANYFLANSGFMSKLRFIVNLFTLPVYIHSKSTTVKLLFTVLPFTVPLRGLLFFPKYKIPGSWVINVNCDSIYRTPLNTVLFCLSPRGAINGGLTVILMLNKLESILMRKIIYGIVTSVSWLRNYQQLVHKSVWQGSKN